MLFRILVTKSFAGTFLFVTPSFSTSSSDVVLITETLSPWISKFCRQCTLVGTGSSQLYLLPIPILTRCSMHGCTLATTGLTSSAGNVSRVMYKVSCGATWISTSEMPDFLFCV